LPPSVGSGIAPGFQRIGKLVASPDVAETPPMTPASFMAPALLDVPPRVPRAVSVPLLQTTACVGPESPGSQLYPATWPDELTANALLKLAPSVPRSRNE